MTQLSKLQAKMGGQAGHLDRAAILKAAQRNLDAVTPQIEAALHEGAGRATNWHRSGLEGRERHDGRLK